MLALDGTTAGPYEKDTRLVVDLNWRGPRLTLVTLSVSRV